MSFRKNKKSVMPNLKLFPVSISVVWYHIVISYIFRLPTTLSQRQQADLIWDHLFVKRIPISEVFACYTFGFPTLFVLVDFHFLIEDVHIYMSISAFLLPNKNYTNTPKHTPSPKKGSTWSCNCVVKIGTSETAPEQGYPRNSRLVQQARSKDTC
jgi:hypothetical protein